MKVVERLKLEIVDWATSGGNWRIKVGDFLFWLFRLKEK
jgi:hypothetical protein